MQQEGPGASRTRDPTIIVQTADVRVVEYTLHPRDAHPWHYHSEVADAFYCLDRLISVETREPPQQLILRPGEKCSVPAKVVHPVKNVCDRASRYLLVQGVGTYDYIKAD